jgi:hypothetical protein
MRHWTPEAVEEHLERRRVYLRDPLAVLVITEMLHKQFAKEEPIPGRRGSSADDCIVHWAPGWAEHMRTEA